MNIRAIIFDVDGVLVNPAYRFAKYLEEQHGLTMQHTHAFFTGRFLDCIVGRADLKQEIVPFLSSWRIDASAEEFLARWFDSERETDQSLLSYIAELRQRGIRCCVGTNQERYRSAYLRNEMAFAQLFDDVFTSSELGVAKPDAMFYAKVNKALNVKPSEVLFWDDSLKNVEAARQFGWHAEHYTTFAAFTVTMQSWIDLRRT